MSSPPEQFNNDAAEYAFIDSLLESLQGAEPDELITHLIAQMKTYNVDPTDPVLKAITTIRVLIEDRGANPDELITQRLKE